MDLVTRLACQGNAAGLLHTIAVASAENDARQVSDSTSHTRTLPSLLRDASRPGLAEQLAKSITAVV